MFGTVARMVAKPGHEQPMLDLQRDWDETRKPNIKGAIAAFVFRSDQNPDEYLLVAVFRDRAAYVANAEDPGQDAWYQKLRSHLVADPEWHDGEIVSASMF
jgi:quinol monooxygenase YgiN